MNSRDEIPVGEERCLRLERHKIAASVDELGGVHVRIRGTEGELLSHLAATPGRARSIATMLVNAADRVDPAGATLLLLDVAEFDAGQRARLRELLLQPRKLGAIRK